MDATLPVYRFRWFGGSNAALRNLSGSIPTRLRFATLLKPRMSLPVEGAATVPVDRAVVVANTSIATRTHPVKSNRKNFGRGIRRAPNKGTLGKFLEIRVSGPRGIRNPSGLTGSAPRRYLAAPQTGFRYLRTPERRTGQIRGPLDPLNIRSTSYGLSCVW